VTQLVEDGTAKLVVIAHDVDPVETVVHLPALCRAKDVPFCFVRGKANLGKFCHMKNATCVALTDVHKEDIADLQTLSKQFMEGYNKNEKLRRTWGGGVMGIKNQHMVARREKIREIELAKKANTELNKETPFDLKEYIEGNMESGNACETVQFNFGAEGCAEEAEYSPMDDDAAGLVYMGITTKSKKPKLDLPG